MASGIYNAFKEAVLNGAVNLGSGGDTIKCALLDNNHSFDADKATNSGWADVSVNEISGTGYTAGGQALTNQSVSCDDTDDEGVFDADDVQWTNATFTAYHAVLYDDTHASDLLIASIDFGGAISVTNGTFTIQWDSEGIVNLT